MPVDVDVLDETRLKVVLIEPGPAPQIKMLMLGLLNARYWSNGDFWSLTWGDFLHFRDGLDRLGFTQGRSASDNAVKWIAAQVEMDATIDRIKAGQLNGELPTLAGVRTPLYTDQITGVRFLAELPGAILADEMGIGKSLQALGTYAALRAQGQAKYVLVLCPNSVKPGWGKEVAKHTDFTVSICGNGTAQIKETFWAYAQRRTDFFVVHFDALINADRDKKENAAAEVPEALQAMLGARTAPLLAQQIQKNRRLSWGPLVDDMLRLPWDLILVDEAHQLKNPAAHRTKAAFHLFEKATRENRPPSRLYFLTGTPVSESPLDAWTLLGALDSASVPKQYAKFEAYFTNKEDKNIGGGRVAKTMSGYRNLGELKRMLHRFMLRRMKSDIKGMPEKVEQFRYIQMSGPQKKLYDDIRKGLYDAIVQEPDTKLSIAFAMTKMIRLRQALNHPKLVEKDGDSAKYLAIDEILEEVLADPMAKVVIWTEFREAVDLLYARLHKRYGAIKLVGGTSQQQLTKWSREWDVMPERVALGLPIFGGTGVDFLSRCRTAIYVEPPWSTILFRQSMDRIHRRVGEVKTEIDRIKASPATLIFLQAQKTIDDLVYAALGRKGNMVDALLTDDEVLVSLGKKELLACLA